MPITLAYPSTNPTAIVTLRASLAALVSPQLSFVQQVHVAAGGKSFVFSPNSTPVENHILPLDLINLFETDEDGFSGFATLRAFIRTTLQASANLCRLTDEDMDTYVVRYLSGLESMREGFFQQWSGQLIFRVEP